MGLVLEILSVVLSKWIMTILNQLVEAHSKQVRVEIVEYNVDTGELSVQRCPKILYVVLQGISVDFGVSRQVPEGVGMLQQVLPRHIKQGKVIGGGLNAESSDVSKNDPMRSHLICGEVTAAKPVTPFHRRTPLRL